jgi:hypothetical protein
MWSETLGAAVALAFASAVVSSVPFQKICLFRPERTQICVFTLEKAKGPECNEGKKEGAEYQQKTTSGIEQIRF